MTDKADVAALTNERLLEIKSILSGFEDGYDTVDDKENYEAMRGAQLLIDELISLRVQLEAERQRADRRAKENYGNKCKVDNCMSTIADLKEELTELKAKLANPVVLPTRKNAGFYSDEEFSNKDLAAIYNCAILEIEKKIHAAGFTTVKGES